MLCEKGYRQAVVKLLGRLICKNVSGDQAATYKREMKDAIGLNFYKLPVSQINSRHIISLRLIEIKALYEVKMCRNNIFCLKN